MVVQTASKASSIASILLRSHSKEESGDMAPPYVEAVALLRYHRGNRLQGRNASARLLVYVELTACLEDGLPRETLLSLHQSPTPATGQPWWQMSSLQKNQGASARDERTLAPALDTFQHAHYSLRSMDPLRFTA